MSEHIGKYTLITCRSCGTIRKVPSCHWLKEQRLKAKLTLRELGKQMSFTASYLHDLEAGRRTPTKKVTDGYEALSQ